jgi:hypothetical protein
MKPNRIVFSLIFTSSLFAARFTIATFAGAPLGMTPEPAVGSYIGLAAAAVTDATGNTYFTTLNSIFKVDTTGVLTRVAGQWSAGFAGDGGPAVQARFSFGIGDTFEASGGSLAIDAQGNLHATMSYRQLHGWILPPLVICAVGAHC